MKRAFPLYLFAVTCFLAMSCDEKMSESEVLQIGISNCRTMAPFIKKLNFDIQRSGFSSNETDIKGIALVQFPFTPEDTLSKKVYQDPSWSRYGFMGSITTDNKGNAFTAPIPKVNTLDNPLSKLNRIYKVDAATGVMNLFCTLPQADTSAGVVAFAVLGVYYDCHANKLYASSVAGSTRDEEKGVIYMINPETGKVEDTFAGHDAVTIFVGGITGEKRLYFGGARSSEIYSVKLNKKGEFKGDLRTECSLEQLGPRGDDRARRIRFDERGNMLVLGVEFNFNLAAQSNKPETLYHFVYNRQEEKWGYVK
jgi:hypothetical protein